MDIILPVTYCGLPLLSIGLVYFYWRLSLQRWLSKAVVLLCLLAALYSMSMDLFLGDANFYLTFWSMLLITIGGTYVWFLKLHDTHRSFRSLVGSTLTIILALILASYLRIVPRADAYATCQLQQYGLRIQAYYHANARYPYSLEQNPSTDIANACRQGVEPWSQWYRPYVGSIQYNPQPSGYLLRSFYTYDPLFIGLKLYRTCSYDPASQQVQCHFQLTQTL